MRKALVFVIVSIFECFALGESDNLQEKLDQIQRELDNFKQNATHQLQDARVLSESRRNELETLLENAVHEARKLQIVSPNALSEIFYNAEDHKVLLDTLGKGARFMSLLIAAFFVVLMQAGFSVFEAGYARAKNVQSVLWKNLGVVSIGTFFWWALGWMFAFGNIQDPQIFADSKQGFGLNMAKGKYEVSGNMSMWFFQWAVFSVAAIITGGGMSERTTFLANAVLAVIFASFIYPIVAHWTWGGGWLAGGGDGHMNSVGFIDTAGGGVVHMVAGFASLIGTVLAGPRSDRFMPKSGALTRLLQPHSMPLVFLGTFIIFLGTLALSIGSVTFHAVRRYSAHDGSWDPEDGNAELAAQAVMNTTISAAVSGIVVTLIRFVLLKKWDLRGVCQGIIAGLVSISAGCANMEGGWAFFTGLLGAVLYQGTSMLFERLKIDDVTDVFPKHGVCGMWSLFAAACFDMGGTKTANGMMGWTCYRDEGGNCKDSAYGAAFGANMVSIVVVPLWVVAWTAGVCFILLKLNKFKVSEEEEAMGSDYHRQINPRAYEIVLSKGKSTE